MRPPRIPARSKHMPEWQTLVRTCSGESGVANLLAEQKKRVCLSRSRIVCLPSKAILLETVCSLSTIGIKHVIIIIIVIASCIEYLNAIMYGTFSQMLIVVRTRVLVSMSCQND